VAVANDGTIGNQGRLSWNIPADLKRFKGLTKGHAVVMGRLTWASLPEKVRPLPERRNLIVSASGRVGAGGSAEVVSSVEEAIASARRTDAMPFIIGGAQIYKAALPFVTRIYMTEVDVSPGGDARFSFDRDEWREEQRSDLQWNLMGDETCAFRFIDLARLR